MLIALSIAAIHLVLVPHELEEKLYVGVLFIIGGLALCLSAVGLAISTTRKPAWALGGLISVGMFLGFVLSRTVGLPGLLEGEWPPVGILSLVLEAVFVALAIGAISQQRSHNH